MARTIDWTAVRQRVAATQQALEGDFEPSPEAGEAILQSRARALARVPPAVAGGDRLEVIEFLVAHETYAIETAFVREVWPLKELTPLPCVPPFVLGIINVRGRIVSVVDIGKFFELPESGLGDLNKVIIVHAETMEFGLLADRIVGVRELRLADLQTALPTLTGIRGDYLKGVTPERRVVLDARKLLADAALVVDEEVPT